METPESSDVTQMEKEWKFMRFYGDDVESFYFIKTLEDTKHQKEILRVHFETKLVVVFFILKS